MPRRRRLPEVPCGQRPCRARGRRRRLRPTTHRRQPGAVGSVGEACSAARLPASVRQHRHRGGSLHGLTASDNSVRTWQCDWMSHPTTPPPTAKAFGEDERSVLLGYLTYHRVVLARKVEGVSDEQARRAASPPSALTLLGLIRHMTDVERWWFRRVLRAADVPALFDDDEEWRVPPDATIADALDAYWSEIAVIDAHLAGASMDDRSAGEPEPG